MEGPSRSRERRLRSGRSISTSGISTDTDRAIQHLSLGLFRSDYMVHKEPNDPGAKPTIKQVEFNTIASSFGGLSTKVSELHSWVFAVIGELIAHPLQIPLFHTCLPDLIMVHYPIVFASGKPQHYLSIGWPQKCPYRLRSPKDLS